MADVITTKAIRALKQTGLKSRAMRALGVTTILSTMVLPAVARAFTTALPAFDAFPMAQWARLSAKHWRRNRSEVMGYGEAFGHSRLRQSIRPFSRWSAVSWPA